MTAWNCKILLNILQFASIELDILCLAVWLVYMKLRCYSHHTWWFNARKTSCCLLLLQFWVSVQILEHEYFLVRPCGFSAEVWQRISIKLWQLYLIKLLLWIWAIIWRAATYMITIKLWSWLFFSLISSTVLSVKIPLNCKLQMQFAVWHGELSKGEKKSVDWNFL